MQLVKAPLAAMLAAVIAATKEFDPALTFVGVYTAIVDNGTSTTLANLTLPVGGSATNVEVTAWSAVYYLADGSPVVDGPIARFTQVGADAAVTIMGYYLTDANPGTVLKAYAPLTTPVTLAVGGTALSIVPRLSMSATADYGDAQQWDG